MIHEEDENQEAENQEADSTEEIEVLPPAKIEESRQKNRVDSLRKLQISELKNNLEILILQHPQEPDKELGTAALCVQSLEKASLRVGLSWSSLNKILGQKVNPAEWGVLYLGSKKIASQDEICFVSKKGNPVDPPSTLKGVVVLDGTWAQVKNIWWRNAWLLKLKRIVLNPPRPSLYGKLRKEPRKNCLSTIESVALVMQHLEAPEIAEQLSNNFRQFLETIKSTSRT